MSLKVFLTIIGVFAHSNYQAIDWCHMPSCNGRSHIACNNNGRFSPTCVNPKAIPLTRSQKDLIVRVHNMRRNEVATGQLNKFSQASRMAQVTWSPELAWLAELNTKQCEMRHDACHNTPKFTKSGQNLAMLMTTATYTSEIVIQKSASMWFNENTYATMRDIKSFSLSSLQKIGHFTAMVTDRTTQVGCAISSFKSRGYNSYLLACNYASTNIIGCSVYKSGRQAQACSLGADSKYPGLCKISEPIDANVGC